MWFVVAVIAAALVGSAGCADEPGNDVISAHLWVDSCMKHCTELGDWSLIFRKTWEGTRYGVCKCLDDNGIASGTTMMLP